MSDSMPLRFFHSPNTRSTGVLVLLEELGAEYELHLLNMKQQEHLSDDYRTINPMGKVPAIVDNGALVTEQVAVYLYLADRFPERGLAPAIGDPLRGPYLRWMAFYGSCFEPAVVDRAQKRDPAPRGMSPYGDFDTMFNTLLQQLATGPYLLGERSTAADVLWGSALNWTTGFGIVPKTSEIEQYLAGVNGRPAVIKATARDAELAAQQSD
ncbi:MAG TPA: glutathione S-transferase family protein [Chromatiales bacterium]|nr:glutathione S-transferase family protein [Chromatiales bacterium]